MKLIIEDDEGRRTVIPLFRDELIIGRAEGSAVRLPEKDVSRRHAKLVRRQGRFYVEDLNSFTGVRVNGQNVHGSCQVGEGDLIEISQYDLTLQGGPDDKPLPGWSGRAKGPDGDVPHRAACGRGDSGGALAPCGSRRGLEAYTSVR
jgi:pSer/pThr/pTyr-binding forkhead associated (FHA) protein